jgi:hypothetical protein
MELFIKMAFDLGLNKVAALLDKSQENEERKSKLTNNYPNYKFEILPTGDIRDKLEDDKRADSKIKICGCFDSSGNLKDKYKNEFKEIIDKFIIYFNETNTTINA